MDDWKSESQAALPNNIKSWTGWDMVGWMIVKSEFITEVQLFSKWDWVGWLIVNVRVKQNWKSESYVSGRIDSMLKQCEFENHMKIDSNVNGKKIRFMKRQNIANLYQKQEYAKYEFCRRRKKLLIICLASHKRYQENWAPYNLAPHNLATGQFGTGQFGTKSIWYHENIAPDNLAPGQFGTRTIWHQVNLAQGQFGTGQFGTRKFGTGTNRPHR